MSIVVRSIEPLDGTCFQQSNAPGLRSVFLILAAEVVGNYPESVDFESDRITLTDVPTLRDGAKWVQIKVAPDSAELSIERSGKKAGYVSNKHVLNLAIAGNSPATHEEMAKLINAGVLVFVEDKDGNYVLTGSTDDPHYLENTYTTGKGGSDERGYTITSEVDGLGFGWNKLKEGKVSTLVTEGVAFDFTDDHDHDGSNEG